MTKFHSEIIEDFLRWVRLRLETDKANFLGKKSRDRAEERLLALKLICEKADLMEVLDKLEKGVANGKST